MNPLNVSDLPRGLAQSNKHSGLVHHSASPFREKKGSMEIVNERQEADSDKENGLGSPLKRQRIEGDFHMQTPTDYASKKKTEVYEVQETPSPLLLREKRSMTSKKVLSRVSKQNPESPFSQVKRKLLFAEPESPSMSDTISSPMNLTKNFAASNSFASFPPFSGRVPLDNSFSMSSSFSCDYPSFPFHTSTYPTPPYPTGPLPYCSSMINTSGYPLPSLAMFDLSPIKSEPQLRRTMSPKDKLRQSLYDSRTENENLGDSDFEELCYAFDIEK